MHGGCSVHVWLADGDWLAAGRAAQSHTHAAAAAVHRCTPAPPPPLAPRAAAAAAVGWTGKKKCSGGREREERGVKESQSQWMGRQVCYIRKQEERERYKITFAAAFSDNIITAHA